MNVFIACLIPVGIVMFPYQMGQLAAFLIIGKICQLIRDKVIFRRELEEWERITT